MDAGSCLSCPRSCIFRKDLDRDELSRLLRDAVRRCYPARVPILHEGDPSLSVRCLCRGHVKEYCAGRRGDDVVLRILGPGALLGLGAVLAEEPHDATVETLEVVEVCILTGAQVREAVDRCPRLARHLLGTLADAIRELQGDLVRRAEDPVWRRTAEALLRLSSEAGAVLPLRRIELAQWIGTAPETLSRTLHAMEHRGWIEVDRFHLAVRDRARLRRAAGRAARG